MKPPRTWWVLLALLGLLVLGALVIDRAAWPSLVGDEATYLMQAESLAFDFDLTYERRDYDRFVAHHGVVPEGLILQSGDGGGRITFGKPFFYALYLAPFVRAAPVRGPLVANALLLAAAALVAARTLERRLGDVAPLWVAALVFASVSFAYTFWVHADLFLMSLTAIALALVFGAPEERPAPRRRALSRWAAAGCLLAAVAFSRPMYATLFLPACLAAPRAARRRSLAALLAGGAALLVGAAAVHQAHSGSFTSYGAARRGFYSYTGFPEVDFPISEWRANLTDWGNHAWLKPSELGDRQISPTLWGWNLVYLLAGRHVGLLPYFLPCVLALGGRPRRAASWGLWIAVALAAAAFLHLRPFNFWGGGGAIANRYMLPLYPACWFLPERRVSRRGLAVVVATAALFMAPLWSSPLAYPLLDEGGYGYVSPVARALPYETTQSHLKPGGREDVLHGGLWIKFLDRGVDAVEGGEQLRLRGGGGTVLVGSAEPLDVLELTLRLPEGAELTVRGARALELAPEEGWRRWRLELGRRRARHPMWWTWEPFYLYRLELEVPGSPKPVRWTLRPQPADAAPSSASKTPV